MNSAGERLLRGYAALVVLAACALFVFYPRLAPHGPHATVVLSWAAFVLALAGIRMHRPAPGGWRFAALAVFLGSLADTVLIVIGRAGQYSYPPILVGYGLCYAAGAAALFQVLRRWPPVLQRAALLDSTTLAIAWLTILLSVSLDSLSDPSLSLGLRFVGVVFPILDAMLIAVLLRIWFAQHAKVPAAQLLMVSIIFLVVYHVVVLLELRDPTLIDDRWNETWVLAFVGLGLAMSSPSVADAQLYLAPPSGDFRRMQIAAIAGSLAVPYLVLGAYGVAGLAAPWQVIACGGLIISLLVALRVRELLLSVQARARRGERLAAVDPLTGAPNRRRWDARLAETMQVVGGPSVPWFWVAMLDLDHFKEFNDTNGHQAGDRLLKSAVRTWQLHLGVEDLLARYGGEEFAILLAGCDAEQAARTLDLVRRSTPDGQTCSIGVARWYPGTSATALMREADAALYTAKGLGRNRVVFASGSGSPPDAGPGSESDVPAEPGLSHRTASG